MVVPDGIRAIHVALRVRPSLGKVGDYIRRQEAGQRRVRWRSEVAGLRLEDDAGSGLAAGIDVAAGAGLEVLLLVQHVVRAVGRREGRAGVSAAWWSA